MKKKFRLKNFIAEMIFAFGISIIFYPLIGNNLDSNGYFFILGFLLVIFLNYFFMVFLKGTQLWDINPLIIVPLNFVLLFLLIHFDILPKGFAGGDGDIIILAFLPWCLYMLVATTIHMKYVREDLNRE